MFSRMFDRAGHSLRTLKRQKRFAATAIVCLGVAIALNTTMYSVLDALLRPHNEIRDPDQIVSFRYFGDYNQRLPMKDKHAAFLALSFHDGVATTRLSWEDQLAERGSRIREVQTMSVSPNWFRLMGLRPLEGRLIDERDVGLTERPVVIGERLWKQLFPERERFEPVNIVLGGNGRHVVGILARSAGFPEVDVFQLPSPQEAQFMFAFGVARLKSGVTIDEARAEAKAVSDRFRAITGEGPDAGWRILKERRQFYGDWNFHYALIGSVVAVLLIACANLANLQLARGVSRARELATRAAVGATRSDIVWQLVLESSWLALGGLLLGGLLTWWGVGVIDSSVPRSVTDYIGYPHVNLRVMGVAIAVTLLCLVLMGLLPALKLSRVDVNELLKAGAGTGSSARSRRQYGALVVVEVALALACMCATGLLVRSAATVRAHDYSEEYRGLVYGYVLLPVTKEDTRTRRDLAEAVLQRARRVAGLVAIASKSSGKPLRHAITIYDDGGQPRSLPAPNWSYHLVSSDYFRASLMPIIRGRDFSPGEFAGTQVIVDSVAARSLWPGRDPVGQQLKLDSAHVRGPWYTVVGVTRQRKIQLNTDADMAEYERSVIRNFGNAFRGNVYVLNSIDTARVVPQTTRRDWLMVRYVARTAGDVERFSLLLRNALLELGPGVRVGFPESWAQYTRMRFLRERHDFMATLFLIFSVSALALAVIGVYSIIAHMVAHRTREFGVRIAVGAGARDIRRMVLKEGNILTLSGIAIGLLLTYKTARWVRAFVFSDWDRYDSRVFAAVALVLFGAAWLASFLPARRAMRINPVEALRNE